MALILPPHLGRPSRQAQRGIGTLLVAVVLLLLVIVLLNTVSRTTLVEQRMSANQVRAKQAHEAAQAGIDNAMTYMLTGTGGFDKNGNSVADTADSPVPAFANATLTNGARYRVALCDPTDTAVAPSCSDTPGTTPTCDHLNNETHANNTNESTFLKTPLIVACGWSDDGIARKMIRQYVGTVPALAMGPTNPITAKGGMNVTGSATVTNYYNNLTIWTGQALSNIGNSGKTYIRNPNLPPPLATATPPGQPPNSTCGTSGNENCYIKMTDKDTTGPDVIANDPTLSNLTNAQMFTNFTGAPNVDAYKAHVASLVIPAAQANILDDAGVALGQAIVVEGDTTLPNGTIGSRARPVVLIINGNWNGGNVTVHGAVYVTGNVNVTGSPLVYGVVVVQGTVSGSGSLDVVFDPLTVQNAANTTGRPGLIPGSWRDW